MNPDPSRPFLHIEGAVYTYPGRAPIVNGIDWRLQAGGFHCLVGRSGCGKTTLLKLAAGLLAPQIGRVLQADGRPATPGPHLGYVFQAPTLLDWQQVIDNVLLPVSLQRRPLPADIDRAQSLLAMLGLSDHAQHYPRQLSGGQQSRVALARALILEPALLLLDEPFAALDAITRGELQDDLLRMCRLRNTTVLFVTHDISEAVYLGDRVAVMHQGRMIADLPVDLPAPRTQTMRHGAAFNATCASVFDLMNGARP
ncbi:nitrate ABC transporter ATP-binding protein [Achromobacter piechaudii]|uniref:Aliphatic sulfonates import ATP-binding protein SsuB n=1 Tax=Achromobacter piechaudii TaxID=72556 RepID=A0ABM8KVY5_9BURK|nr:ABC transporter ATP-binding protein [Achromobacter piechaudii]KNY11666.1 nitrate ABC transporter ATP-binding protein [Achromobacter piechaudii]CAB3672510.1 Aliphatic sulfonates import ATP-binding protein SsuB [Achromobacter piechaudii]CAB3837198.1 Aliphatic sulfonates import ATP-binding protein SsuB [Achromobacter piechaudii]CAB3942985.1 Aliphatic sulfonates import ATP-binding protein SsuB [Achromobacter piechaudii]